MRLAPLEARAVAEDQRGRMWEQGDFLSRRKHGCAGRGVTVGQGDDRHVRRLIGCRVDRGRCGGHLVRSRRIGVAVGNGQDLGSPRPWDCGRAASAPERQPSASEGGDGASTQSDASRCRGIARNGLRSHRWSAERRRLRCDHRRSCPVRVTIGKRWRDAASFFATAAARLAFAGAGWRDFATAIAGAKHANSTSNDRACAVKRFISSNGTGYDPGKAGQDVPRAGEPRRRGHCMCLNSTMSEKIRRKDDLAGTGDQMNSVESHPKSIG